MTNLYLDKRLEFSENQAITTSAESENALDFGVEKCSAEGKTIDIRIKEDFAGSTSLQFVLQDSADGTSYVDKLTSPAFQVAQLKAKGEDVFYSLVIPKGLRRFIRLKYVVTGTFTKGKVHAILNTEVRG